MADPTGVGLAAFFLAIVGKWVTRHGDLAANSLAAVIYKRIRQGEPALPPNHDVEGACRSALQLSLEMLAKALELSVYRPKTLAEACRNTRDENGKWKPVLNWRQTHEGDWFDEFVREIQSVDSLKLFNLKPITNASSVNQPIQGLPDTVLEKHFNDALVDWIELRIQRGSRPEILDEFIHQGWPINRDAPGIRITFYKAWCLFLQDRVKKDENVFRSLTSDWLASIDSRLTQVSFSRDELIAEIQRPLGDLRELMVDLNDTVGKLLTEVGNVSVQQGELLLLFTEYRIEVDNNFSQVTTTLCKVANRLGQIGTSTARSEEKQIQIHLEIKKAVSMLETLLARQCEHVAMTNILGQSAGSQLLATLSSEPIKVSPTKLLHTAANLIGRDDELTRLDTAWNDEHTNVVVIRALGGVGKTSLVAAWRAELVLKNWCGAEQVFDWSFYSQGTRDQGSASADLFIAEALAAFGDPDPTAGSPWDKGARLAKRVGEKRALLVLDGLEPLQYPPGPMHGKLKDPSIESLLKGLCANNRGLCVVTTRERVDDIQQHYSKTAEDWDLTFLNEEAGAAVLHTAGARRSGNKEIKPDDKELKEASREVAGHALTLQLVGQYLALAEDGDIRKRDTIRLAEADQEYKNDPTRPYGHAFKAMTAYEKWFEANNELRQLAILRLLGLFDRAASRDCLNALCKPPIIEGLTKSLVHLAPRQWNIAISRLKESNLVTPLSDGGIECHPLIREYFGERLRTTQPEAWKTSHKRLYEHLRDTTDEDPEPKLKDLQPLYQAVWHGCQAGLHKEVRENVYRDRICGRRGTWKYYSKERLGAYGSDLAVLTNFFADCWTEVTSTLDPNAQAWLLHETAVCLRAIGRLQEAVRPLELGLQMRIEQNELRRAAILANNLSELELALGNIPAAVDYAERSVQYAEHLKQTPTRATLKVTWAEAIFQSGRIPEALAEFRLAEELQFALRPPYCYLYSNSGYYFCDLLLMSAERAAWAVSLKHPSDEFPDILAVLLEVQQRSCQTLKWTTEEGSHLPIALDHLTLARILLYRSILADNYKTDVDDLNLHVTLALGGLRKAGTMHHIPRSLLTSAWYRHVAGDIEAARDDLNEAWEIAERGPMPLYQADIRLYRARLFGRKNQTFPYPWESVERDLAEAQRLIKEHGYGRRLSELEDAKKALLS
jgi:tetratricopeptide (TPR) repeat protein